MVKRHGERTTHFSFYSVNEDSMRLGARAGLRPSARIAATSLRVGGCSAQRLAPAASAMATWEDQSAVSSPALRGPGTDSSCCLLCW